MRERAVERTRERMRQRKLERERERERKERERLRLTPGRQLREGRERLDRVRLKRKGRKDCEVPWRFVRERKIYTCS